MSVVELLVKRTGGKPRLTFEQRPRWLTPHRVYPTRSMFVYVCVCVFIRPFLPSSRGRAVGVCVGEESGPAPAISLHHADRQQTRPEGQGPGATQTHPEPALVSRLLSLSHKHTLLIKVDSKQTHSQTIQTHTVPHYVQTKA